MFHPNFSSNEGKTDLDANLDTEYKELESIQSIQSFAIILIFYIGTRSPICQFNTLENKNGFSESLEYQIHCLEVNLPAYYASISGSDSEKEHTVKSALLFDRILNMVTQLTRNSRQA